jgi:uncharacterized protein (UPF0261 family)
MADRNVYVVGTADTKGEELDYIRTLTRQAGAAVVLVDVGTRTPTVSVDVPAREVASFHAAGPEAIFRAEDRGSAVSAMSEAFASFIISRHDVGCVLGIGGGGGTSIVTAGMRALPIGVPKLIVSTLASGDVSAFVDTSDITMMPAVTDIAGLNRISRRILRNAAAAMAAMALAASDETVDKPAIALTMFGVTTPAVSQAA